MYDWMDLSVDDMFQKSCGISKQKSLGNGHQTIYKYIYKNQ